MLQDGQALKVLTENLDIANVDDPAQLMLVNISKALIVITRGMKELETMTLKVKQDIDRLKRK